MLTRSYSNEKPSKHIAINTDSEKLVIDEIVSYICRLPPTIMELEIPETLDLLNLREFALLAKGLNLSYETAPEIISSEKKLGLNHR